MAGAGTRDAGASTRIGVAAVCRRIDVDPAINRAAMADLVDRIVSDHPKVRLVVFGETSLGLYYRPADPQGYQLAIAEPLPGPTFELMSAKARAHSIYIAFGLGERSGDLLYNTVVLVGPDGSMVARHRKTHLCPWDIAGGFRPGDGVTFTEIDGLRTAIIVCYDSMDPELVRSVGRGKPALVLCPLADMEDEKLLRWELSSINYGAWSVFANRVGNEDGNVYEGHVWIADPTGRLRAKAAGREGYIYAEVAP
jgi:predicted amidohydrolase